MLIANRYEIENPHAARIGRGGMGDVYRARDATSGATVAVKHLQAGLVAGNPQMLERFTREGEVLRRLDHPNIVKVLDSVADSGEHYIVMEYVPGGTLRELLNETSQLPLERALELGLGIVDALTRAHHLNIIHRDIKPGNILLGVDGTPLLTDFGLAQAADMSRITASGALPGTYAYLAPEIYQGSRADTRSDIWSLGVVLFEMLTGRLPFHAPSLVTTMNAIMTRPLPDLGALRPDVPEALVTLIQQMLVKQPDQRLGSARLVGAQLEMIRHPQHRNPDRFATPEPDTPPPTVGPRHNLPTQPTPFVGRHAEIEAYARLLTGDECRLLTLVGPGGIGKTRLAVETAQQLVNHFPHGVRFVALAPAESPSRALPAVADALQLTFMDDEDPWMRLVAYLREKQMLLVLDNFEHVLSAAPRVAELLNVAPGCKILATSREALSLSQEWVRRVEGLPYPTSDEIDAPADYAALQLFSDRARRYRDNFDLAGELPAVAHICRLVDGMPLAIELAASWLGSASVRQIADEVARNFDFLSTTLRDVPDRHRSLRAVFDYSWERLQEAEREALAALTIFCGGFTAAAADAVTGTSLLTLRNLVNKSLLNEAAGRDDEIRYEMHRLVRQYAAEKRPQEMTGAVAENHGRYYLRLLATQEPALKGHGQRPAVRLIKRELDNFRTAWRWALEQAPADHTAVAALSAAADALLHFYELRGLVVEGEQLLEAAVNAVRQAPVDNAQQLALARLHARHAQLLLRLNRWDDMEQAVDRAGALLKRLPQDDMVAYELALSDVYRCLLYVHTARMQETGPLLEAALQVFEQQDAVWAQILTLNTIFFTNAAGNRDSHQALKKTVTLSKKIGDRISLARALLNLSQTIGDPEETLPLLRETLELYQEIGHQPGIGLVYEFLGGASRRKGDLPEAQRYYEKALAVYADVGYRSRLTLILRELAEIAYRLGNPERAEQRIEKVLRVLHQNGDTVAYIQNVCEMAQLQLDGGFRSEEEIRNTYQQCVKLLDDVHAPGLRIEGLDRTGKLALDLLEYGEAEEQFREMGRLAVAEQQWSAAGWANYHLARVVGALGCYKETADHLSAALRFFTRTNNRDGLIRTLDMRGRLAFVQKNPKQALADYQEAAGYLDDYWSRMSGMSVLFDWGMLQLKNNAREEGLATLLFTSNHPFYNQHSITYRDRRRGRRVLDHYRDAEPELVHRAQTVADELTLDQVLDRLRKATPASLELTDDAVA